MKHAQLLPGNLLSLRKTVNQAQKHPTLLDSSNQTTLPCTSLQCRSTYRLAFPGCGMSCSSILFQQEIHHVTDVNIHRTLNKHYKRVYIHHWSCCLIVFMVYLQELLCSRPVRETRTKGHASPVSAGRPTLSTPTG